MARRARCTGAEEPQETPKAEAGEAKESALSKYCVDLNVKARKGDVDPLIGREAEVERCIQVLCRRRKNNPLAGGRPRRGQDRHRRRPRPQDRERRDARGSGPCHDLLARHGRAAGRHPLSRRFRGTAESRRQGDGGSPRRDPLHRRDPHRDRRRRHLGRRDGCLEPAEARAAGRQAALHGLHHLQGIPPALRKGPRAVAAGSRRST